MCLERDLLMDDLLYGTRNKRGDWRPFDPIKLPPVFVWPVQPIKFLKWLFGFNGYLWPWNAAWLATSAVFWYLLLPPMDVMATLSPDWIAYLLLRNAVVAAIWYSVWHFLLYVLRRQDTQFKFNGSWPTEDNSAFLFNNQTKDNVFRTLVSAVPIFTAWEVFMYWAIANNHVRLVSFAENPFYVIIGLLLVPLWFESHFHFVHRAFHWAPLYKWFHRVHHNNVNTGPWSGLAMHPIEHVFYFSMPIILFFVPFHPLHLMQMLIFAFMSPARGHAGFGKMVVFGEKLIAIDSLEHYLHHKYHKCNYGTRILPFDKWFGSFHDGSPESRNRMLARLKAKHARRHPSKAEA